MTYFVEMAGREGELDRSATPKDLIGYHALTQAAMKSVLRSALRKVSSRGGLPGEHHFYITFRTRHPGVQMADHLKDRYPDEMTIVIQHQYTDLEIYDDRFEIILRFQGVPQHLRVPFAAVSRFFDPAVNFGLQFEPDPTGEIAKELADMSETPKAPAAEGASVVSLDAFRRK